MNRWSTWFPQIWDQWPSLIFSSVINLFHDVVPLVVIRQSPFDTKKPIARHSRRMRDHADLNLNLLAFGDAKVFVELDHLAVNIASQFTSCPVT